MTTLVSTVVITIMASIAMFGVIMGAAKTGAIKTKDTWVFSSLFNWRNMRWADLTKGLAIHCAIGLFFGLAYLMFWSIFNLDSSSYLPVIGLATGAAHGLLASVSEAHLLDSGVNRVRSGMLHFAAHSAFGLVLGLGFSMADIDTEKMEMQASITEIDLGSDAPMEQ